MTPNSLDHSPTTIGIAVPKVSIGLTVFNGERTLRRTMDALLKQSVKDFELIISDNCSTDTTQEICLEYSNQDSRVRYVRQDSNVGMYVNFRFVLEQAKGEYFMWSACDDVRSQDFLEHNIAFLEANRDYVASASPNGFETGDGSAPEMSTFSIEGPVEQRFNSFLNYCWKSHGVFYSLIRTSILKECDVVGQNFLGADWAIDLYIASRGQIKRTKLGSMISGAKGVSSSRNAWRAFHRHPVEWLFPFVYVSRYAFELSKGFRLSARIAFVCRLLVLNFSAAFNKAFAELYQCYCAHFKAKRKQNALG